MNLIDLIDQFPNVTFVEVSTCHYPRCEDATYMFGAPAGRTEHGRYIRMTNRHGGGDTIPASDETRILALAAWHNAR